jgi:hypothetical protein
MINANTNIDYTTWHNLWYAQMANTFVSLRVVDGQCQCYHQLYYLTGFVEYPNAVYICKS